MTSKSTASRATSCAKAVLATCLMAGTGALTSTPAQAHSENRLIGEIITFGGHFCPRNTLPADGRILEISDHTALYSIFGIMFGGDGRTTFGLPDMRGATTPDGKDLRYCVVVMGDYPMRR